MKPTRGFTLVEVLFALGLFMVVIIPILQTEMLSARSVNIVQQRREALAIASARLDAVQHANTVPEDTAEVEGYQVSTTSSKVNDLPVPLTRIEVDVRSQGIVVASLSAYRM